MSNIKSLRGCYGLNEEGLKQFTRICRTSLKSLDLSGSRLSSAETGMMLSQEWPELEHLNFEHCRFSQISFTGSTATLPNIKSVNLSNCNRLTDIGLLTILSKCGDSLETLLLASEYISGKKLAIFPRTLPNLSKLDLSSCPNLSSEGLAAFLRVFGHNLKSLSIGSGSSNTNDKWITNLRIYEFVNYMNMIRMIMML